MFMCQFKEREQKMRKTGLIILMLISLSAFAQNNTTLRIGLLKYGGGGDWYANPSSLPNLIDFVNKNLGTNIHPEPLTIETGSPDLFKVPFVHMTGHGNVFFSDNDVANLKAYLMAGGFLHIDDNYGLDPYIRREMKKVFPDQEFVELPITHPIYYQIFPFEKGLPKIHEHDNKPPQGFGLFHDGKLVVFYTYETDLGNGWESYAVHKNPEHIRQLALKMGTNILAFAFHQNNMLLPNTQ
jgi:hypothetical protein